MSRSWDMGFHVTPIAPDPSEQLLIALMRTAPSGRQIQLGLKLLP